MFRAYGSMPGGVESPQVIPNTFENTWPMNPVIGTPAMGPIGSGNNGVRGNNNFFKGDSFKGNSFILCLMKKIKKSFNCSIRTVQLCTQKIIFF